MVPRLRERYLAEHNARIARLLSDPSKNETERFWEAMDAMQEQAKVLRRCLDGHCGSKMQLFLMLMTNVGMLKREDLAVFSEDLQKWLSDACGMQDVGGT